MCVFFIYKSFSVIHLKIYWYVRVFFLIFFYLASDGEGAIRFGGLSRRTFRLLGYEDAWLNLFRMLKTIQIRQWWKKFQLSSKYHSKRLRFKLFSKFEVRNQNPKPCITKISKIAPVLRHNCRTTRSTPVFA